VAEIESVRPTALESAFGATLSTVGGSIPSSPESLTPPSQPKTNAPEKRQIIMIQTWSLMAAPPFFDSAKMIKSTLVKNEYYFFMHNMLIEEKEPRPS
jgi:hypothetical protein